jgi:hypothetical protein
MMTDISSLGLGLVPNEETHIPTFDELHGIDAEFFRRGVPGAWREELPADLHELFWSVAENAEGMVRAGYGRQRRERGDTRVWETKRLEASKGPFPTWTYFVTARAPAPDARATKAFLCGSYPLQGSIGSVVGRHVGSSYCVQDRSRCYRW